MTNVLWPLGRQKPFFQCAALKAEKKWQRSLTLPEALTPKYWLQALAADVGGKTSTLWQTFQSISATFTKSSLFRELQTEVKHYPLQESNFTGSIFSSCHRFNDAISTSIPYCSSGRKFGKASLWWRNIYVQPFLKRAVFAYGFCWLPKVIMREGPLILAPGSEQSSVASESIFIFTKLSPTSQTAAPPPTDRKTLIGSI